MHKRYESGPQKNKPFGKSEHVHSHENITTSKIVTISIFPQISSYTFVIRPNHPTISPYLYRPSFSIHRQPLICFLSLQIYFHFLEFHISTVIFCLVSLLSIIIACIHSLLRFIAEEYFSLTCKRQLLIFVVFPFFFLNLQALVLRPYSGHFPHNSEMRTVQILPSELATSNLPSTFEEPGKRT